MCLYYFTTVKLIEFVVWEIHTANLKKKNILSKEKSLSNNV
jgi:hypothetical protein